jgi:hypothetical protein
MTWHWWFSSKSDMSGQGRSPQVEAYDLRMQLERVASENVPRIVMGEIRPGRLAKRILLPLIQRVPHRDHGSYQHAFDSTFTISSIS